MKRLLILIIFLFSSLFSTQVNGQVLITLLLGDKLNSDQLSFGLAGGFQTTSITNLEDAKFLSTFNLGFFFDIKLAEGLYLHPEVLVKSNLGARNLPPYPTSDPGLDELLAGARVERRINYFNVPILAKYRTAAGWGIEAGPQFSLRHKAKDEFKTGAGEKEELLLTVDIRDQLTRLDAGFAGGLSRKIGKTRAGVTIYCRYYAGLVDIDKVTAGKQRNQSILINAAIPIGAGKDVEEILDEN
jgi:hypothetical protein